MLQIDLRVRAIDPRQAIWRLFPGKHYRFLSDFRSQEVGYLDIPDLDLVVDGAPSFLRLLPRIARSQAIQEKLLSVGSFDPAEMAVSNFVNARSSANRTRISNAISNLYKEAKAGDLVVLPEPISNSKIWIGRIRDGEIVKGLHRKYGDTPIPARNIEWLISHEENSISTRLSQSLRNQYPFTLIERSLYTEVLALTYGSFVYGDHCASTVYNGDDFLDADSAFLGTVSKLSAAACQLLDTETESDGGDSVDLLNILLTSPPPYYSCSQESDIHSKGFTRFISSTETALIVAGVCATLFGLSACSSKAEMQDQIQNIEYVNSSPNSDPQCNAKVSEASKKVLDILGIDQTWKLCEDIRNSKRRNNLKPTAVPSRKD